MLYFNTLFEDNPAPVAYHVSPNKPMNFPSSKPAGNSVSSNNNANMNKMMSSNEQRDKIDSNLLAMKSDSDQMLKKDLQI